MMEVSSVAKVEGFEKGEQVEDEDQMELSLELSIGRKSYTKSNPLHNKSMDSSSSSCRNIGGLDFTEESQISVLPRSVVAQIDPATDQQSKREIQALRRQEARKKREDKLKIKAVSRGKKGGKFSSVDGDWERRENHDDEEYNIVVLDEEEAEPPRKKEKNEKMVQNHEVEEELVVRDLNLTLNNNGSNSTGQMQYPYRPALQYVPFTNGLVYPYGVVPCWGSVAAGNGNGTGGHEGQEKEKGVNLGNGGGNEGPEKEKKVSFEPAACRSFQPYNRNSEQNGNEKLDGSSGGSSSAASDYQNSSLQGGNNSDTGSSASKFPQENLNALSAGNRQEEKSENNCDSNGMKSNEAEEKATTNHIANMVSSSIHQSSEAKCSEEPKSATELADPLNQPILSTQDPIPPALLKEETTNGVIGKPPILRTEHHGAPSLPQMPCVSTTGNGPNGKTITGFLYRYTKTEVSIVCVCHGTSFSPSEFVEHAGGVDVAHPLRHITVMPCAFV